MHLIINAYNGISMVPELSRLNSMVAAHFYSLNQPPEEEALNAALQYANNNGLTDKTARLFGRNIYLTDKPEPHGYEYFLTEDKPKSAVNEVVGGLYASHRNREPLYLNRGLESFVAMGRNQRVQNGRCEKGSAWLGQQRL